jgi:thioredoxin 1
MAFRVNEHNFEEEVLKSKLPVLVEFYSESCIPCKQQGVILSELEVEYEERIKLVKVNVNFDGALAERYQVMASPTLLFLWEEREIHRITGLTKKAVLKDFVEQILATNPINYRNN